MHRTDIPPIKVRNFSELKRRGVEIVQSFPGEHLLEVGDTLDYYEEETLDVIHVAQVTVTETSCNGMTRCFLKKP